MTRPGGVRRRDPDPGVRRKHRRRLAQQAPPRGALHASPVRTGRSPSGSSTRRRPTPSPTASRRAGSADAGPAVGRTTWSAGAAEIGFPLLLKPAESHRFYEHFKRRCSAPNTMAELRAAYAARRTRPGSRSCSRRSSPARTRRSSTTTPTSGTASLRAEFTARQLRKAPPAFGSPRVVISERIAEVIEPGRKILAAMGFDGFACTEFKLDRRDGVYKLMEVNGRHNLSGLLAVRCGVNFPLMHYRHLAEGVAADGTTIHEPASTGPMSSGTPGTASRFSGGAHTPVDYVAPYARRHCDAIFDRQDMGPFGARLRYLLGNARPSGASVPTHDDRRDTERRACSLGAAGQTR